MTRAVRPVTVVIPARYGSSRFPGKPLVELHGKPMIQHVYERAAACRMVTDVLVATDDERIVQAVERFGGGVTLMSAPYRTGTDRVAAVARTMEGEFFLDLQGDEIPMHPDLLTDLIEPFIESDVGMGTLKRRLDSTDDLKHASVVKVVTDVHGDALYFSRAPIPLVRDDPDRQVVSGLHYIHLGLYIYRKDTLLQFAALPTSQLEDAEKLEQLRALDHGIRVRVWETTQASLRVDSPEDVPDVAKRMQQAHTHESEREGRKVGSR